VIERHSHRRAARAFKYPHPALQVREIGGRGEVSLVRILASPPAPESADDTLRFRRR